MSGAGRDIRVDADVLVVGAGPAGSTAARFLSAAGVSTLLLDRAIFPRQKPCGGALSARTVVRFPYLRSALDRINTHWISRLHLEGPSGRSVDLESPRPAALMVRRLEFDHLLKELAREAGATIVENADVVDAARMNGDVEVCTRDGRRFAGRYLIAADGVHSVTARRLGIVDAWPRSALAIDMMEEAPTARLRAVDPNTLWVRYGVTAPNGRSATALWEGYAYVFPKHDHVNVGIGYLLPAYRAARPGPAYDAQRAFVNSLIERGIVAGASARESFTPFLIPVSGPRAVVAKGRVLLAGDAAGFVHGLTAEGIYYAMVSGNLAAKALIEQVHKKSRLEAGLSYSAAWRAEVGAELRDSVRLQHYFFGDPSRIDAAIAGASGRSPLSRRVIEYFMGEARYSRVRAEVLLRNPSLLWSLVRAS
jgi:geranylgeranyl reductase family protein